MILAILRAQWLSMRSFRLGSSRRGAVLSIFTGLLWYGFWTLIAFAAEEFTSHDASVEEMQGLVARGLLLIFLYWQLAPLISASLGASLDLKKLLVYPIPHRLLFVVEVLLRVTTCIEMLLVLTGGLIGMLRNPTVGGWQALPRLLLCYLAFALFNLLLSAGLRNLLERLLARKGLREVLVLFLVLFTALPRLLMITGERPRHLERWLSFGESIFWPWTAAGRLAVGPQWTSGLAVLAAWTVVAWAFGRWQFERSLRYDAQAMQATDLREQTRREGSWMDRVYRIPALFLPDPVAAIVEKELRTLSRTPRFRLVFIMGFSFGILVWLPIVGGTHTGGSSSAMRDNFLVLVGVYALTLLGQVSYWNAFGFDRSATQVYFSTPVPVSTALAGKNIAATAFIFLEMAAVTSACLLLRMRIPAGKIVESFVTVGIAALYMLGMGNLGSVHYPRPMNPERVSHGGAGSRLQGLLLLLYPLALLPIFLAYLARAVIGSQTVFLLVLAFAAVLGGVFYRIAMDSAVETARKRREEILSELSRTEGPVVSE